MTQKEKNMMKLVSYHLIYMGPGRVSKEKKEKLFVEVYNHFNRKNKKKLIKRSDIVAYMSELKLEDRIIKCTDVVDKMVKRERGKFIASALMGGLLYLAKRKSSGD